MMCECKCVCVLLSAKPLAISPVVCIICNATGFAHSKRRLRISNPAIELWESHGFRPFHGDGYGPHLVSHCLLEVVTRRK